MPNIYLIIGGKDSGKTSAIASLTGATRKTNIPVWQIQMLSGVKSDFYIELSALQERPTINPQNFIIKMNNLNPQNILIPLRFRNALGCPNAQTYINDFYTSGWNIAGIVLLDPTTTLQINGYGTPVLSLPGWKGGCPSNMTASQIRLQWGWA